MQMCIRDVSLFLILVILKYFAEMFEILAKFQPNMVTYHIDLSHGVDEDDWEYSDGKTEEEGAGQVPNNTPEERIECKKGRTSFCLYISWNGPAVCVHPFN